MKAFLFSHILTFLLAPFWVRSSLRWTSGQQIRDQGPSSHKSKEGTPTAGGIVIFLSCLTASLLLIKPSFENMILLISFFLFLLLGLIDDFFNLKKTKALGLPARYKLLLQIVFGSFITYLLIQHKALTLILPFTRTTFHISLAIAFPFYLLTLIATVNAANITDGLDGLATGILAIAFAALSLISFQQDSLNSHLIYFILIGSCTGFLWLNFYPARVFLGNAGSMGLGAALATLALLHGQALFLPFIAVVFVIETLSVIIQVVSFQLTGKRIFKMSPLHHHFELSGMAEASITVRFWLFTLLFSAIILL